MNECITKPNGATELTQKELFKRFLATPCYENGNGSMLLDRRTEGFLPVGQNTPAESGLWPCLGTVSLSEFLLEELAEADDPEDQLIDIVQDIRYMLEYFEYLEKHFKSLAEATLIECPDRDNMESDAFQKVIHEWEANPRYILPRKAASFSDCLEAAS